MSDNKICKHCGNKYHSLALEPAFYVVDLVYQGFSEDLYVIQCYECRYELIPVKVLSSFSEQERYETFQDAWNKSNV